MRPGTVALFVALATSCRSSPGQTPIAVLPADEQAVIGQAILDFGSVGPGTLVLARQTDGPTRLSADEGSIEFFTRRVSRALFLAYDSANAHPTDLSAPVRVGERTVRFEDEVLPPLSGELRSVYHVTRAGFNAARDSAIVGVSRVCGMVCGNYQVELYVRSANGWRRALGFASGFY